MKKAVIYLTFSESSKEEMIKRKVSTIKAVMISLFSVAIC